MHFLEQRKAIKKFLAMNRQKVYCQACGDDLTNLGGLITENKKIYCGDVSWCLEKGLIEGTDVFGADFFNSYETQRLIQEGYLIFFHKPKDNLT